MEIVFATNNKHKLREIKEILGDKIKIISLKEIGCNEEIPETQPTIAGNASQKAFYIYNKYGYNCFADDTGLEVDALEGQPGVYSARYAGKNATFADNVKKLLTEMQGKQDRKARFVTVISLVIDGLETLFEGEVKGQIIEQEKGTEGFGYDPVFLPDLHDQTFAEMAADTKNAISHRGKATRKLASYLIEKP